MNEIEKFVRQNIKDLVPYSSARSEFKGKGGIFLDANENPWGRYNRYPDPFQVELKEKIAAVKGIRPDQIYLGNGSDGIVDTTYRIFCEPNKDKSITAGPTFMMYIVASMINNVELIQVPLDDEFKMDMEKLTPHFEDEDIKIIFLCSPNNPTGNLMREKDIQYVLDNFKGIVVLDEAYIDFSGKESYIHQLDKYPRLIVLQTMSKAWGMAGARLGMAIANPEVIYYYNKIKTPYNISTLNQEAALNTLTNGLEDFKKRKKIILEEKERVLKAIQSVKAIEKIYPSDTNFFLTKFHDGPSVYKQLVAKNVIVRNQHKVIENCMRITIGTPEENDKLIAALKGLE